MIFVWTGGGHRWHAELSRTVGEGRCSHIFSGLAGHEIRSGIGGGCYVINALVF